MKISKKKSFFPHITLNHWVYMTKRLKMIVLRTMIYLKKKDQTGNVDSKISEASNVRKSMAGDELRNLTLFSVGVF